MIKKLLLVFMALSAIKNVAQEGIGTASPYSFYGLGSLKFKGTVENVAMGGISVFKDSIHINLQNPATYGGQNLTMFNNESRPVKYTIGGSHSTTELNTFTKSDNVQISTFDYLALSIPVGKFGFGFGLMPYTAVGYKLENRNTQGDLLSRYDGRGGVNKTFLSFGYEFPKGISLGVEANYNFGNIVNRSLEVGYNNDGEQLEFQSLDDNRSDLSGLGFNFGLHYYKKVTPKLELQSAFTYAPETELKSKNQRFLSVISVAQTGEISIINSLPVDLLAQGLQETTLKIPSKYTIGFGLGKPKKWFASVEYSGQNTESFSNKFLQDNLTVYENSNKIALGGFFIPKYNTSSGYWKRVVYRAGARSETTGLVVNGKSIKEFGMSFGLGLPVGRLFSNTNFSFEYGVRGTTTADLVRENFMNFQLSLSLNDRWFIKRKYD